MPEDDKVKADHVLVSLNELYKLIAKVVVNKNGDALGLIKEFSGVCLDEKYIKQQSILAYNESGYSDLETYSAAYQQCIEDLKKQKL